MCNEFWLALTRAVWSAMCALGWCLEGNSYAGAWCVSCRPEVWKCENVKINKILPSWTEKKWKCAVQDTLDRYNNPIDSRATAKVLLPQSCSFCLFSPFPRLMRENIVILCSNMDKQIPDSYSWGSYPGYGMGKVLSDFCVPTSLSLLQILLPSHSTGLERNLWLLSPSPHTSNSQTISKTLFHWLNSFSLSSFISPHHSSPSSWMHECTSTFCQNHLSLPGKPGCSSPSLPFPSFPDLLKLSQNARKLSQLFLPLLLPRILPLPAMEQPFQQPVALALLLPLNSCALHKE